MQRIYLDNNATTPLDDDVLKGMLQVLQNSPLNPSSMHFEGVKAKNYIETAREEIAECFNVPVKSIIFTSGGSECMSLLISNIKSRKNVTYTTSQHACVTNAISSIASPSFNRIDKITIEDCNKNHTLIDTIVNSETGQYRDLYLSTPDTEWILDGVQSLGKINLYNTFKQNVGVGFSGHKIHGPQGSGFIINLLNTPLTPLIDGGGQEFGLRNGTQNVAGIVGLAIAVKKAHANFSEYTEHMMQLRDRFEYLLVNSGINIECFSQKRVCNTSCISFLNIDGESLFIALDREGISASLGTACSSGGIEPSQSLLSIGYSYKKALSTLRFSFSRMNTMAEVEESCVKIINIVKRLS